MERSLLAAALAAAITPTLAYEPHNYTYIEAAWVEHKVEADIGISGWDDEIESDGYAVKGSYLAAGGVLFQVHYGKSEVDKAWGFSLGSGQDIDTELYGVFVGGVNQYSDRLSTWGGFGYDRETLDIDVDGLLSDSIDSDVYSLAAGARYWLAPMVELNGTVQAIHVRSNDLDDSDNDAQLSVGLRFQPVSMFSVGVSYSRLVDAESDTLKADARLQF